jgi:hypothetical protein
LYFSLETPEGTFNRLTLLDLHLSHENHTPFGWPISIRHAQSMRRPNMLGYHGKRGF